MDSDTKGILGFFGFILYFVGFFVIRKHEVTGYLMTLPVRVALIGMVVHEFVSGDWTDALYGVAIVLFMSFEYEWFWKAAAAVMVLAIIVNQ